MICPKCGSDVKTIKGFIFEDGETSDSSEVEVKNGFSGKYLYYWCETCEVFYYIQGKWKKDSLDTQLVQPEYLVNKKFTYEEIEGLGAELRAILNSYSDDNRNKGPIVHRMKEVLKNI